VAWTAILIGLAVLNASKLGWIPLNVWTENASQIGIVMLVVLLSFTLADQINNDRTLRLNAQAVALGHERKARASQQALIQATESANRELEQRVESRTTDLNATLEQLRIANERLQLLSTTDGLTQIGNRAFFDTALDNELRRAERQQRPLSLILFDIDHFKRINDTHGHLAGDACLRTLADLLRPRIHRAGDILARYGGEEFVIALMDTDLAQSLALAEEFRAAIAALEVIFDGTRLCFTASFGVVSAVPHPQLTAQMLLAAADRALYEAKGAGRNCVRSATLA
jgi:diguanylate cyclase